MGIRPEVLKMNKHNHISPSKVFKSMLHMQSNNNFEIKMNLSL